MARPSGSKSFLDTSIARPFLHGTSSYREYLKTEIPGPRRYVSNFVLMEIRRGLICPLIDFYFVVDLPTIRTLGDALAFWAEGFKTRGIKTVLQYTSELFSGGGLDTSDPKDKPKGLKRLAFLIERLDDRLIDVFTNTGVDAARCARAAIMFNWEVDDHAEALRRFREQFSDEKGCRQQCRIDHFLFDRYRAEVAKLTAHADGLPKDGLSKGFLDIAQELHEVVLGGASACSCKRCERIGDAVIALDAPRSMQLEHTDHSFDHICLPIDQPHRKHPSQTAIIRQT